MNRQKRESNYVQILLGNRLKEVITMRGFTRTQLINALENEFNYNIHKVNLSRYINGVHSMPQDFVLHVSEILEIDEGYLFGSDIKMKYKKTYEDYIKSEMG